LSPALTSAKRRCTAWCLACFLRLPIATRLGGMICPVGASMRSLTVELGEAEAGAARSALTRERDAPLARIRSACSHGCRALTAPAGGRRQALGPQLVGPVRAGRR
jgi:hypothetical protein